MIQCNILLVNAQGMGWNNVITHMFMNSKCKHPKKCIIFKVIFVVVATGSIESCFHKIAPQRKLETNAKHVILVAKYHEFNLLSKINLMIVSYTSHREHSISVHEKTFHP